MTLIELENLCNRGGLTRQQTADVLTWAGDYALTQCVAALAALDPEPSPVHLLDLTKPDTMNACEQPGVNTTRRGDVTCGTCLVIA